MLCFYKYEGMDFGGNFNVCVCASAMLLEDLDL